ncbi:hypothetical protein NicSoilC12_35830 [Arthrobacter sp. NicSoilC12]|nr:hypothetical protein NicSoilC12_35830 [Arthrobacter sp. NicSoilC12]
MGQCPWQSWTLESAAGSGALASIDCAEGDEPVAAQRRGESLGAGRDVRSGLLDLRRVAALHVGEPLDGELPYGLGAGRLAESAQRHGGDVEVVVAQVRLALGAQDVAAGGPSGAGTGAGNPLDLDHSRAREVVQVAAHGGRSEAQEVAEFGCADGSVFQHRVQDAVARALFGVVRVGAGGRGNGVRNGRHVCPGRPDARGTGPGRDRGSSGSGRRASGHSGSRHRGAHGIHNTIMS